MSRMLSPSELHRHAGKNDEYYRQDTTKVNPALLPFPYFSQMMFHSPNWPRIFPLSREATPMRSVLPAGEKSTKESLAELPACDVRQASWSESPSCAKHSASALENRRMLSKKEPAVTRLFSTIS